MVYRNPNDPDTTIIKSFRDSDPFEETQKITVDFATIFATHSQDRRKTSEQLEDRFLIFGLTSFNGNRVLKIELDEKFNFKT